MSSDRIDADELAEPDVYTSDSRGEIDRVPDETDRIRPDDDLRALEDRGLDRSDG